MNGDNIFAAIDIGSSKICTLVAEADDSGSLRILGVGITPSQGVKKGMIDNIQEATKGIITSVEKAERSSDIRIVAAHISIGGTHTASMNNRGISTMPGEQRSIGVEDIDRALEGARSVSIPNNREVLHVIPRYFVVDGQEQVTDPIGMFGQRIDIETHIVTGALTAIQNLNKCVEEAGVQVEQMVLSPLAAAEAVLEEEEQQHGVILADIGGGTTSLAVFVDGAVFHTAVLPIGGYHLTHDLVAGIRAPFSVMEEAKIVYGSALPSNVEIGQTVQLEAFGGQKQKEVSRRRMAEIIQARMEETLEMIHLDVKRAGFDDMIAAGLVLTGGTASLPGLDDLAEQVLHMPVRIGTPRHIHGMSDALNSPAYAASVGLLRWSMHEADPDNGNRQPFTIKTPQVSGIFASMRNWLKELLPQ